MKSMHAAILSIGDELALGQTVDTNSAYLSRQLARHGIPTLFHETIADDLSAITAAIRRAADTAELVLISGGLGPTEDDLTRQAIADAMDASLVTDDVAMADLQAFFDARGKTMPQRNTVQATRPEPASIIRNSCGTAPGLCAEIGKAIVYATPGVPRELFAMFDASIEPELERFRGARGVILTTTVNTFGAGESNVAERLGALMARDRQPRVGTTVSDGFCCIRIRSEEADRAEAQEALDHTADEVSRRLGPIVFGRDQRTLSQSLYNELKAAGQTLATAESCTGGLAGAMVTQVPGTSEVYVGGWVTYTNAMKQSQLGVSESTLTQHGAVSAPVVREMALGALDRSGADLAVSISGVAGPGGGTDDKPVGLVWFALAQRDGGGAVTVQTRFANLPGDREQVRDRAAKCALQMARLQLRGDGLEPLQWLSPADDAPDASGVAAHAGGVIA